MAQKVKGTAISAKGVLLKDTKDIVKAHELSLISQPLFDAGYDETAKSGVFVKEYEDSNGNGFYAVLEFKTTTLHPDNASVKASKPKKDNAPIEIVFEDEDEGGEEEEE